jgi:hypothetical protein
MGVSSPLSDMAMSFFSTISCLASDPILNRVQQAYRAYGVRGMVRFFRITKTIGWSYMGSI